MGMAENNIEWGTRGEIEFNIKSNLNKKIVISASRSVHFWPTLSEIETFYDGPYIAEF